MPLLRYLVLTVMFLAMPIAVSSQARACGTVVLGWEEWEPFTYKGNSGQLVGIDIELVSAALKRANCNIVYTEAPWARILEKVKSGEMDITSGASKTEERETYAYFSDPYRQAQDVLVMTVSGAAQYRFESWEQLINSKNFWLNVTRDYSYGPVWEREKDNPLLKSHMEVSASDEIGLKKVIAGRVNGTLMDVLVARSVAQSMGLGDKIAFNSFPFNSQNIHVMGTRKPERAFIIDLLNREFKTMEEEGLTAEIIARYRGN